MPLNNQLGDFNPYAVEHGLMLGARMVWMPTLCALDLGFSAGEIRALTSENASRLVGIDPPACPSA